MKKVLFITRHAVPNYGSILQAIASVEYFRLNGIEAEVLDYVPQNEKPENLYIPMLASSRFSNYRFLKGVYTLIRRPDFKIMGEKFREYQKNLLPLTKEYNHLDENSELVKYDAYITGSDQVWGKIALDPYDKHYFWDFIKDDNIFSFSASFGKTQYSKEELEVFEELLKKYRGITVRENTALDILKKMNIYNAKQILDPTLLVEKKYWNSFASSCMKRDKYIVVYQIHDNKEMNVYAKKMEKYLGIPLIRVSNSFSHIIRNGKLVYLPTPEEFLGLIRSAEYVLTDSFHATVFSILFERNFSIVHSGVTNTRIESLLKTFDLENRSIKGFDDFTQTQRRIDYQKVNEILEKEREKSNLIMESFVFSKIRGI